MEDRYGEDRPRYNYLSRAELDPGKNMNAYHGWWILAAAILFAAFLSSGLYSIAAVSEGDRWGYVAVVNRFTGSAWFCYPAECRPIPVNTSATPSPAPTH
jgi:hypothetical protein